jgi:hypothetical protein
VVAGQGVIMKVPFDQEIEINAGGIKRHVTSTSWNNFEYQKLKKLQADAPVNFLRNNLSSFIKYMVLER